MNSAAELVLKFKKKGGVIWAEEGCVHYTAPPEFAAGGDLLALKAAKVEVLQLLGDCKTLRMGFEPSVNTEAEELPELLGFQEAYLTAARESPEMYRHNLAYSVRVWGDLDRVALRDSLSEVARVHPQLLWRVRWSEGKPSIAAGEIGGFVLGFVDVAGFSDEEIAAHTRRLLNEDVDVTRDPLFKVCLLCRSATEHILIVSVHHFIADAASVEILFEGIWSGYARLTGAVPASPLDTVDNFGGFCRWLVRNSEAIVERSTPYWSRKLAGATPWQWPVSVPPQRPPFSSAVLDFSIGAPLTAAIRALAEAKRITPAIVLLSAYVLVAAKACNLMDLTIPTVLSGRNFPQFRRTVGSLAQLSFIKIELNSNWSYSDLFVAVSQEFNRAWDHMDYGLVIPNLPSSTALGNLPFFEWTPWYPDQSCGDRQPADWSKADIELRTESYLARDQEMMTIASVMYWYPARDRFRAAIVYRADLYSGESIQALLETYERICEQMVHDPSASILFKE